MFELNDLVLWRHTWLYLESWIEVTWKLCQTYVVFHLILILLMDANYILSAKGLSQLLILLTLLVNSLPLQVKIEILQVYSLILQVNSLPLQANSLTLLVNSLTLLVNCLVWLVNSLTWLVNS